MKRILLCFLLAWGVGSASAETLILSRESVVRMALEQNEGYKSALLEKDRVRGQYLEARSGAFPRLSFDAGYQRNIDLQTSVFTMTDSEGNSETMKLKFGTPHNYSFGLSFYQPLYAAGKVGAAIKIAKYGFAYTDAAIDAATHDIATRADKAYLDAVSAREAAVVFREAERLADSNLAVVQKLYDQGQVSEFDLLRAQVQAANTRPDRIAADNTARLALDQLRNLLALAPETELVLDSTIGEVAAPLVDEDALVAEALANRPELRQSDQLVNINQKLIDIAEGGYKPTLGLSSQVAWTSMTDKFKQTTTASEAWNRSWVVGLSLSWPIFSGFETVGKIRQAKVDYSQSQLSRNQLSRQVRLEVQDAVGKLKEAGQRVDALGQTVTQAERGVEIAQVRYRNGVGTQLELLDAQVALTASRVNRISARHDLVVAIANLRRAVGRPWASQW
ncbi:MAG: TolC family protein [candidate division Zixibacteria bacterium]|nr:TolC family protein [candidate division Zixibacteria bacterium]